MGLANVSECCSIAAAIQGWASCSNSARPAPRKVAASRLTCQVIDRGPNMPDCEPAAAPRTRFSSRSRLSVLTISSGSWSVGTFMILPGSGGDRLGRLRNRVLQDHVRALLGDHHDR